MIKLLIIFLLILLFIFIIKNKNEYFSTLFSENIFNYEQLDNTNVDCKTPLNMILKKNVDLKKCASTCNETMLCQSFKYIPKGKIKEYNINSIVRNIYHFNGDEILLKYDTYKSPGFEIFKNSKLAGKVFVITGSLNSMTRSIVKEKIDKYNARLSNSISSNTDFLILGDNPGSKFKKAKQLNIKIINEKDFLTILENS